MTYVPLPLRSPLPPHDVITTTAADTRCNLIDTLCLLERLYLCLVLSNSVRPLLSVLTD
ncbi:hypothetical protein CGLO_10444 [Colletotrichum gloeosporioides Cg-14]|uniref:Uncharacterized protein n=1 Tax=Colletotrichum gloeosporioides (strain Cg-14) TaxID=1237896 RepID=T0LPM6_COLGC|nr:hypothetical protein CGLO_10444 [Colletotrichum gloeosporioides Cg-14]